MAGPQPGRGRRRAIVLATALPVLALTTALTTAAPAAATLGRVSLPSPNPGDLAGTTKPLDPAQQLDLRVYLTPRPGLAAAAQAVSDPGNPAYGHYSTPAQVQQRYAPTAERADTVRGWLTGQGMTVTAATPHYLAVTATVAQADATFDTRVSEYDQTEDTGKFTLTTRSAGVVGGFSVPSALAADVLSVTGIEQLPLSATVSPEPATGKARTRATADDGDPPCSRYWGQYTEPIPAAYGHTTAPTQLCGYTPDQVRRAYGLTGSPYTGGAPRSR